MEAVTSLLVYYPATTLVNSMLTSYFNLYLPATCHDGEGGIETISTHNRG